MPTFKPGDPVDEMPNLKFYFSFGQCHAHSVNGVTFDKDCLAEIEAPTFEKAREIAFDLFGAKFAMTYDFTQLDRIIKHFPRGIIKLK